MKDISRIGHKAITWIEDIGLLIIAVSTVIAVGIEVLSMLEKRTVTLADLLLLFIYLEVLAMVAMYLDSGKLPVRMPLYIAIVALARYMILDMKDMDSWRMLAVAGAQRRSFVTPLLLAVLAALGGALIGKPAAVFTSTSSLHGGQRIGDAATAVVVGVNAHVRIDAFHNFLHETAARATRKGCCRKRRGRKAVQARSAGKTPGCCREIRLVMIPNPEGNKFRRKQSGTTPKWVKYGLGCKKILNSARLSTIGHLLRR